LVRLARLTLTRDDMSRITPAGARSRAASVSLFGVFVLLLAGCATGAQPGPSAALAGAESKLVIMGTTDTHGWLFPHDYYTGQPTRHGLLLLAPVVDSIRSANPGRTLLVDSGDLLQGNPLTFVHRSLQPGERHPVIEAMNWFRYDAAAIGNHEFNYGIPHLEQVIAQAEFPFLSANTFVYGTDRHAFPASTIVERQIGGRPVRVGILGVTPPGVLIWDRENVTGRLDFREIVGSVRPVVDQLRRDGADVVVVASHGGLEGSSYDTQATGVPEENMAAAMAREIPGIDVIFLGHTHREVADTTIAGTLLVQGKNWGTSLAVAELTLRPRAGGGWEVVGKAGTVREPAAAAPEVPQSLVTAHARAQAYVSREIGNSRQEMTSRTSRVEDTPIIDFINEVQRRVTGADLSSTAAFTLNARIPQGPVTVADIAGLYVYDNTLKAIRISGAQLREYLEKSAEYFLHCPNASCDRLINPEIPGYNFDVISGVDYTLDVSRPVGSRVVRLERDGAPVQPADSFTLALNNYRASGAGGFNMLVDAPVVYDRGEQIRELLIAEVERRGVLEPREFFEINWYLVPPELRRQALLEQGAGYVAPAGDAFTGAAEGDERRKRIRVIGVNDFHGNLRPTRPTFAGGREVGGAPALATYYRLVREAIDAPTILLDGGDTMQGTPLSNLSWGRATVDFYNQVGFTAAAIGNHEFDWGVEVLKDRVEQANFSWLGANIFMAGTDTLPSWVQPTATVVLPGCAAGPPACDAVTVGIIGLATTDTPRSTMPSHVVDFDFRDEAETIDLWVPRLREEGADFVLVTIHEGAYCPETETSCSGPIIDIAARLRHPPDLIVSGHSHTLLNLRSDGVPIVQASSAGSRISIVDLERVSADSVGVYVRDQPTTYADLVEIDAEATALLDSYLAEYGPMLQEVITRLDQPLLRDDGEYPLGNVIADAMRRATGAEISFMNNGGIRTEIREGPVTYEDLFRLQPFANTMVTMDLTGVQLLELLEHTVARGRPHAHVSGVRVQFSAGASPGARVRQAVTSDGRPIDPARTYRIVVNNFMAEGGDGYTILLEGGNIVNTGIIDLDALIAHLRELPTPLVAPPADRYLAID
jgi:2',3'-cyclic-nucleotide 2'-phosphodiesterase / 3'-nucleotidase / 5'-nucleotidase